MNIHNVQMKIRAIHLLRRLERINRDLEELSTLRNSLHQNREYTNFLRDSLAMEETRLQKLKSRILSQVISNPPESLLTNHKGLAGVSSINPTTTGRTVPEITFASSKNSKKNKPEHKKKRDPEEQKNFNQKEDNPQVSEKTTGPEQNTNPDMKETGKKEKTLPPFSFRFE